MKIWIEMGLCCLMGTATAATDHELSQKEKDRRAILAMAGTYNVAFHFQETVSFLPDYELKPAYDAEALEEIIVVEDSENRIILQHVLQTKKGIIKHWRQDWEYENDVLLEYQGDRRWTKRKLSPEEVAGTWTQRVFQVDDSPRYESQGRWTHIGNLSQWESQTTYRPLPRREYTKRDDYQVLVAKNRQTLTPTGWVHEQDNYKLVLKDGERKVIARELGWNRYDRTDPERCEQVRKWWRDRQEYWAGIRTIWAKTFADHDQLLFRKEIDGLPLYKHLFQMDDEANMAGAGKSAEYLSRAKDIIGAFLTAEPSKQAASTTATYD